MEELKSTIHKHLGRKVDVLSIYCNILAVDLALKPAFLYDASTPDSGKLVGLVTELRQKGFLEYNLNIVELGMDCMLVNVGAVKQLNVDDVGERLVDVSSEIKAPAVAFDVAVMSELKTAVKQVTENLDSDEIKMCVIGVSRLCNITTLFGFLLDYPVLYWFKREDNCLSMEPLVAVKIVVKFKSNDKNSRNTHGLFEKPYCHNLYQFSYPVNLSATLQNVLERFYARIKSFVKCCNLIADIEIVKENVSLISVAL